MLLKISLILGVLSVILTNNIFYLFFVGFLLILSNILLNKKFLKSLKKILFVLLIYATTLLVQLFLIQEGEVLFKLAGLYVTKEGLVRMLINLLRVVDMLFFSWLINAINPFKGKLGKYNRVIEIVVEMIPEALVLIKKKMKFRAFFRHIFKEAENKISVSDSKGI